MNKWLVLLAVLGLSAIFFYEYKFKANQSLSPLSQSQIQNQGASVDSLNVVHEGLNMTNILGAYKPTPSYSPWNFHYAGGQSLGSSAQP